MANEIEKKQPTVSSLISNNTAIKQLSADLQLTPQQLQKANSRAITLSTDPKLSKCDPYSLIKFCYETARYNFTRDEAIYPVPYGNKVQAQLGYKGLAELAYRSGKYNRIDAEIVYECDKVFRDKYTGVISVEFNPDYDAKLKSKPIGYFAFALNKHNELVNSAFMSSAEMEQHAGTYSQAYRAKTSNSFWNNKNDYDKMAKKTVMKVMCRNLDMSDSSELALALQRDQIVYGRSGEADTYADNPRQPSENKVQNKLNMDDNSGEIIDGEINEESKEEN